MDSRAPSLPTSLMFLIMDPFFKHYTPQLAHNCCPCHMNYASCNENPGSLALDKSQAVEEAGVITKTIPGDLDTTSIIWWPGRSSARPFPPAAWTHPPPRRALINSCWGACTCPAPSNVLPRLDIFILCSPWEAETPILCILQLSLKYPLLLEFLGLACRGVGEVHLGDINGKESLFK